MDKILHQPLGGNEMPRFGGIATMLRLPHVPTAAGLDADNALGRHDSGTFFPKLDDLLVIGPTFTNVNDFRAVLILPDN